MQVGKFIYLKSSTIYAETYDVPTVQGSVLGYNAGYVGKVTKLDVPGVGESQTYTEIQDKYLDKRYINNKDIDKFDFNDVAPEGSASTPNTNGGSGGNTWDKISTVLAGIFGIFSKTQTNNTGTTTPQSGKTTTSPPEPTPANNGNTGGLSEWVKNNIVLVIIGAVVIVGGIIWAVVAAIKADKKDKEFQKQQWENKTNNQLRQFGMVE